MSPSPKRADYGLDAPGLVRGFALGGAAAAVAGAVLKLLVPTLGFANALVSIGASFFLTAMLMLLSSRVGKLRARDRLLDTLGLAPTDVVLDVGCGRGLLLVGAAKRLPDGIAIGIDLWQAADLSANSKAAALANAAVEGVAARVEVRDGDMRELPFADATFDAVVACFSIHNVPDRAGREKAVREIYRVLKPGGSVALFDFAKTGEYAATLASAGACDVRRTLPWLYTFPPGRAVSATKPSA